MENNQNSDRHPMLTDRESTERAYDDCSLCDGAILYN